MERWRANPVVGSLLPLNVAGKYVCPPMIVAGRAAVSLHFLICTGLPCLPVLRCCCRSTEAENSQGTGNQAELGGRQGVGGLVL